MRVVSNSVGFFCLWCSIPMGNRYSESASVYKLPAAFRNGRCEKISSRS